MPFTAMAASKMDYNIIIREECHFVNWPFFEVLTAESSGIITLATDIDYGIFVFNFPLIEKYGEKNVHEGFTE